MLSWVPPLSVAHPAHVPRWFSPTVSCCFLELQPAVLRAVERVIISITIHEQFSYLNHISPTLLSENNPNRGCVFLANLSQISWLVCHFLLVDSRKQGCMGCLLKPQLLRFQTWPSHPGKGYLGVRCTFSFSFSFPSSSSPFFPFLFFVHRKVVSLFCLFFFSFKKTIVFY